MKIGIIGAGEVGATLAKLWVKAGHHVMVSSRHPGSLQDTLSQIGGDASSGTVAEAADFGDVVVLAVSYATLDDALTAAGDRLDGKVVLDATNPLRWVEDTRGGRLERLIPEGSTAGAVLRSKLPRALIVKAFTTPSARSVSNAVEDGSASQIAVPIAADHPRAAETGAELVRQAGFVPVDIGLLDDSQALDPGDPSWGRTQTLDAYPSGEGFQRSTQGLKGTVA